MSKPNREFLEANSNSSPILSKNSKLNLFLTIELLSNFPLIIKNLFTKSHRIPLMIETMFRSQNIL